MPVPLADHRDMSDRHYADPPQSVDSKANDGQDAADEDDAADENLKGLHRGHGCRNSVLLRSLQSFADVWT
jgi:hypothetical protein